MPLSLDNIVCLDFEASALGPGSYPIEVAVADCASGDTRSWLIHPCEAWLADGVWSAESAKVHNIPREELRKAGVPVKQVAADLANHVAGKRVLCDGGDLDRYWCGVLFEAAELKPGFALEDFDPFAWDLAVRSGRRPDVAISNSELEAQIRFPIVHRAAADARWLAEMLRLIAGWP
jgi:DNA polymerase III epsilon subunit-like protein